MTESYDVIVVGGGAMGTSAAWNLARRGRRTLVLERFAFGHARGSSGGPTRIFRYVYDVPEYVRMACQARERWDELQAAAGVELLRVTGGLDIDRGPATAQVLASEGVPFERLHRAEARERWPSLRIPSGADVLSQADGGVLRATDTVLAQARLAAVAGATLRPETAVASIVDSGDGAQVLTEDGDRLTAAVVVVSAGSWAAGLLGTAGIDLALEPTQEQASHYTLEDPADLPTVIDWGAEARPVTAYLVPDPWEPGRFKVGLHRSGTTIDPLAPHEPADAGRLARVAAYVHDRIAPAAPTGEIDTCRYTITPDEDFVLDRVGALVIASPCSGHGFKFVPLIGEAIADLATGAEPPFPLDRFRADRPGLRR